MIFVNTKLSFEFEKKSVSKNCTLTFLASFSDNVEDKDVNFDTILLQLFNFLYYNMESISLIDRKLCAFQ